MARLLCCQNSRQAVTSRQRRVFSLKLKKEFGHFNLEENLKSAKMDGWGGLLGNCLQLYQREASCW